MVPLRVGVLGPVTAWRDGREVAAGQPRQLAVLGILASRANQVVSRGELVDAVWGEDPPASAGSGVYNYVAGLRRVLEPDQPRGGASRSHRGPGRLLVSVGGGYLLRLGPGCLDAGYFEQCLTGARGMRASGDTAGAARAVDEALALWRGQPFAGVPGPFAEAERRRLTELRTTAAVERADLLLVQGLGTAAVAELAVIVADHPLRERARGLLMLALYRCGRQAEALRVFHEGRERLAEELGIDPGSGLTRLYQQLLAMDPALDSPQAAGTARASELAAMPPGPGPATAGPCEPADLGAWPATPTPAQLPPDVAGFAGRAEELRWLHGLLPGEADDGGGREAGGSRLAVITGTAGVGKTTLAIRFARQAVSRFPDGQLYVNLRGFDPESAPLSSATALQGFFDALGVPLRHVPATVEAQSALLRTLLDGKRMLLLIDNAHHGDQVRPLLPGSPGCMVVVTSRSQLTGLVAAEGARILPLNVLDNEEAASLLAARLGRDRVAAEPDAVARLVEQSAGLPLALSVACARAVTRPGAGLADLAAELADARGRLDVLCTGEETTDLRAVFSWSVDRLTEPAARTFRLLGLHPGPDASAPAVASLTGATLPQARAALAELARASLLSEDAAGRFSCHDLLRGYAAERAAGTESERERAAARRRLLDHYLHTAQLAASRLYPARGNVPPPAPRSGITVAEPGGAEGESYAAALAWFTAEHRVLRNVLELAASHGLDEHCWQLAWCWSPLLKRRGRLHEVAEVQRAAMAAARRLGDENAIAHVHYDLGHVAGRLGDYQAAHAHLCRALDLFTRLADVGGIGQARYGLAMLLNAQHRYPEALEHATEALRLRRSAATGAAVAYSENAVGWILAHLGRHAEGLWHCRRALELHQASGSRTGAADTLDSLGYAYGGLADYPRAVSHYERALEVYQQVGDPEGEAGALLRLGDVQLASGGQDAARRSWERALAILSQIPGMDASEASGRTALLGRLAAAPGIQAPPGVTPASAASAG